MRVCKKDRPESKDKVKSFMSAYATEFNYGKFGLVSETTSGGENFESF